jgi:hypothetical protein
MRIRVATCAALVLLPVIPNALAAGAPATKRPASTTTKAPLTGKLTILAAPTQPVPIFLARTGARARVGSLNLLVTNDSPVKGELRVRFFVSKTGDYSDLAAQRPDQLPGDRPAIYLPTTSRAIGVRQTRLLQLRFATSLDAPNDVADGLLVVTLEPARRATVTPITLRTYGQYDTGAPASPMPKTVSMVTTSALPFGHWWLWGEHQRVLIPAKRDETADRTQVAVLGSDSGGLLRATLKVRAKDEGTSNGMTRAGIVVDHVGRSAKYSGDVVLGPNDADRLLLTVHVRDFFLWPFLVLFAGAFLGGFGTMRWEQRRRRALLVKRAKDAYATYGAFADTRPADRPPPALAPDPRTRLNALVSTIKNANDDDAFNEQVHEVASYEGELRRWLRLAKAADLLSDHPVNPEAEALAADVQTVLEWLAVKPEDDTEGVRLAEEAERLAEIVDSFLSVWQLWEVRGRPDGLSPAPLYVHRAFAHKPTTLDVRRKLEERRREILQWHPPEFGPVDRQELLFLLGVGDTVPVALAGRRLFWKPFDQLSPAAIEHRTRMFDWAIATASAVVTLLAFLLTKYGQDYGSLSDYAQAFTAGFVGQLAGAAVAWNLFPPFRSYRATETQGAAKAAVS